MDKKNIIDPINAITPLLRPRRIAGILLLYPFAWSLWYIIAHKLPLHPPTPWYAVLPCLLLPIYAWCLLLPLLGDVFTLMIVLIVRVFLRIFRNKKIDKPYFLQAIFWYQERVTKIHGFVTPRKGEAGIITALRILSPIIIAAVCFITAWQLNVHAVLPPNSWIPYAFYVVIVSAVMCFGSPLRKFNSCTGFLLLLFVYSLMYAVIAKNTILLLSIYAFCWIDFSIIANTEVSKVVNTVIGLISVLAYTVLPRVFGSPDAYEGMFRQLLAFLSDTLIYFISIYTVAFILVTVKEYQLKLYNLEEKITLGALSQSEAQDDKSSTAKETPTNAD